MRPLTPNDACMVCDCRICAFCACRFARRFCRAFVNIARYDCQNYNKKRTKQKSWRCGFCSARPTFSYCVGNIAVRYFRNNDRSTLRSVCHTYRQAHKGSRGSVLHTFVLQEKLRVSYLSVSAASAPASTAGISLASSLFSSAKRLIFIVLVFANCPDLISSLRMHL